MKWEYLVEGLALYQGPGIGIVKQMNPQDKVTLYLNSRGGDGWELVQFSGAAGAVDCNIYEPGVVFVFKRPKG